MKAIYVTSPLNKKGQTFHVYNVVGTPAEIEDYKNSPSFKQYPSFGENGEVQFLTNFISMEDEVNFIKKKDGNYTLDNSAFNKNVARLNAVATASAVLADKFAVKLADALTTSTSARRLQNVAIQVEETADETTDSLDNM